MGKQMFTRDQGATKSYRTLARGAGCDWVRTYRGIQQQADRQPRSAVETSPCQSGEGRIRTRDGA